MASFSYVAIDSKGKQVKGSVEADNQGKASESLKRDGMTRNRMLLTRISI